MILYTFFLPTSLLISIITEFPYEINDMEHSSSLFREIKTDLETVKRHLSIIQTLLREQPVGIIKISHETGMFKSGKFDCCYMTYIPKRK